MHGKLSKVFHDGSGLFSGLNNPFQATRYHSLIIQKESLSKNFQVNAWTDNKTIMAIQHKELPLLGVQFHPESIATDKGIEMLKNFLNI